MLEGLVFVVKRPGTNIYLDPNERFGTRESAYKYCSEVAFSNAEDSDMAVYLRFPSGKEIEVSKEDFVK
jgi:hypothetical protein